MKITEVRASTVDVPLSHPVILGEVRYPSRDYVIVEIATDEGISGLGYGMARYAPVAAIVTRNLAPLLVGQDPLMNERLWESMFFRNLPIARGIYMRALSAVDIALWDLKGKALGVPIWKLLGGARTTVPAQIAGGYVAKGKTNADLARELSGYVEHGFRKVKIAAGEVLREDTERLRTARSAVGSDVALMYDAHWAWREVHETGPIVRRWDEFDLTWIEDPFPTELLGLTERLREYTRIPLAVGEDVVGRFAFDELMRTRRADFVRVDATTVGGFTEAVKICALAATHQVPVSPHIFPEVHVHLGAAYPNVYAIEVTDPAREIDVAYKLLARPLAPKDGAIAAPEAPGLGVELDRKAVARFSTGGT